MNQTEAKPLRPTGNPPRSGPTSRPGPRRGAALAALLTLLPSLNVVAQEALLGAINRDAVAFAKQSDQAFEKDWLTAGPVSFALGASFSVQYNDNFNASGFNPLADEILTPGLDLKAAWQVTKTSRLTFGVGVSYAKYLHNSKYDQFRISPLSDVTFDIQGGDFVYSFFDKFSYSPPVTSVAALSGVSTYSVLENSIGARVTWSPDKRVLQFGYTHSDTLSPGSAPTEADNFDYLDGSSENAYLRAGYRFFPKTQVGLEVSGSLGNRKAETQSDVSSISTGPYLEWQVRDSININARGGFVHSWFSPTQARPESLELDSYYSNLTLSHRLTDFVSHSLSGGHQIDPGVNAGSDYVESSSVRYNITWRFRPNTSLGGNASYVIGNQPGIGTGSRTEDFDQFGYGLNLSHNFTTRLSGSLGYTLYVRESNLPDRGYRQNLATLSFRYQF